MKQRRDRLANALALSRKLWRLQTLRLAQCEARLKELRAAERSAFNALQDASCEPALILLRLESLGASRLEAEQLYRHQLSLNQLYGRRAKQMERLHARADAQFRNEAASAERKRLIDLPKISVP